MRMVNQVPIYLKKGSPKTVSGNRPLRTGGQRTMGKRSPRKNKQLICLIIWKILLIALMIHKILYEIIDKILKTDSSVGGFG